MKLDLRKYVTNKDFIKRQYELRKHKDTIANILSTCSTSSHCPLVAMCFYLSSHIGFTPELIEIIDRLVKFYSYTEILGQEEESPYLTKSNSDDIKD